MVDFSRLNYEQNQPVVSEPRQLYQTLSRDQLHEYLRDVQGDVLDKWYQRRHERDIVIKMNTGSGKTLVGLVLLWSALKEGQGPALYLCPNNHLVSQVQGEADRLGIKYVDFETDNRFPTSFHESSGILITTVQRLFNGRSLFKVAGQLNPVKVGTVVIDDAHACINIVRQQFTATFSRSEAIGKKLYRMFDDALKQQSIGMHADIAFGRRDAYLQVPYWTWENRLDDIAELFSSNKEANEIKFIWDFFRNGEVLANCTAAISGDRIEICPKITPVELVPSFNSAPRRVYMSATLVDDASLVKEFGASPDSIKEPITPKTGGDIGERLIISPSLVDSRIEEAATKQLLSDIQSAHGVNVVVLVPSANRGNNWKTATSMHVPNSDIVQVIQSLSSAGSKTAVLANRYDGVDLPGEACRVLVLDDLPQEHRIINLIEAAVRQESPIVRRQLAQMIEQGMGRGVRSRTDYCIVLLVGTRLVSFMSEVNNQSFFTEETKQQIAIGRKLAGILDEQNSNAYQAIIALASQCLDRDPGWQQYHRAALQSAPQNLAVQGINAELASAELRAWQYALKGQYDRAANEMSRLVNGNITPNQLSEVDRGWYLQIEAEYLYHFNREAALEKQYKAHDLNSKLLKPPQGVSYRKIQAKQTDQSRALLDWIQQSNEPNALIVRANVILDALAFGVSSDTFEQAFNDLGRLLGFESQRPDAEGNWGSDVLWQMTNNHYLIIEAKNQVELDRQYIHKSEAEQLDHHVTWFAAEYPNEQYTPILIHPSRTLDGPAYLPQNTLVIQPDSLQQLVQSVRNFIGVLASKPVNQWTVSDLADQIAAYGLRPSDLLQKIGKSPGRRTRG